MMQVEHLRSAEQWLALSERHFVHDWSVKSKMKVSRDFMGHFYEYLPAGSIFDGWRGYWNLDTWFPTFCPPDEAPALGEDLVFTYGRPMGQRSMAMWKRDREAMARRRQGQL